MEDKLNINYKDKRLGFSLSYGYLDGISSGFDFETQNRVDIERFNLSVNSDELESDEYLLLEELSDNPSKMIDVELSLDGLSYKGKAKLARYFAVSGLNISLELYDGAQT